MSKTTLLAGIFASLLPKSEKTLSEKLTAEELNVLGQEAADIDAKLKGTSAADLASELTTAKSQITELEGKLSDASAKETNLNTQITELTKERNTYKEQHEKAAEAGKGKAKEDENSRDTPKLASYNAHALEAFNRANPKK